MLTCTAKQVMSWGPCETYNEAKVRRLFGRRKRMNALQILALKIPPVDRLWAVLREDLIDARTLRLFACDCAERALKRKRKAGREPDERSWNAIHVARAYAEGRALAEEMDAAGDATGAVAWDAARDAAGVNERHWQVRHLIKIKVLGGKP